MQRELICPVYSRWLRDHSDAALILWTKSYESGITLEQGERVEQALRSAVLALELAELLVANPQQQLLPGIVRLTHSGLLLIRLWNRQQAQNNIRPLLKRVFGELERALARGAPRGPVMEACNRLLTAAGEAPRQRPGRRVAHLLH
ncbi:hypothetical protein [Kineobactrum salinum]|uniref:Uncharacterized protein n=1 Tax=Kineobactrum salinum TaxID=2708301 RepID=A0A6C0TYA4_9GAMM|nr:hypothetical protein [Kineobactrum salinum]QIB64810.1 hypothetical protein G3T16_04820 [Kineobactrum salinum]